jgi:hypothetical protein
MTHGYGDAKCLRVIQQRNQTQATVDEVLIAKLRRELCVAATEPVPVAAPIIVERSAHDRSVTSPGSRPPHRRK